MGSVYRAHHLMLDRDVALKTFKSTDQGEEGHKRFQREAQALAKLTHKNIVQVFDYGQAEDGAPYYTMEFLVGESLAERIHRLGALSAAEAIQFFVPVCQGLALAHSKGIVHRDLKPTNLFIEQVTTAKSRSETIKIVDFGIASLTTQSLNTQKLTTIGTIFGSPLYMSPEQSMGLEISEGADIYSLGCALFETLTGSPPFHGRNSLDTIMQHHKLAPPRLSEISNQNFSPALERVVATMLAKNPDKRQASMGEVAEALAKCAESEKVSAGRGQISPGPKLLPTAGMAKEDSDSQEFTASRQRAPLWVLIAAVALLCAGSGCALYFLGYFSPLAHDKSQSNQTEAAALPVPAQHEQKHGGAAPAPSGKTSAIQRSELVLSGQKYVTLQYPDNLDIGYFCSPPKHDKRMHARGSFKWPVTEPPLFEPSAEFMEDPANLSIFLPNDLYGLGFLNCRPDQIKKAEVKKISRLTGLQYLDMEEIAVFGDDDLDTLASLDKLSFLGLNATTVSGTHLAQFPLLKKLSWLRFSRCVDASKVVAALRGNKNLTMLQLKNDNLNESDFKAIATIPNLIGLNLDGTLTKMSDISCFIPLKKLEVLMLPECKVTIKLIDILEKFRSTPLKELYVSGEEISESDRKKVKQKFGYVKFVIPEAAAPGVGIDDWRNLTKQHE